MMTDEGERIQAEIATDNTSSRDLSTLPELIDRGVDQWQKLTALVLDSVTSAHSRRAYRIALEEFIGWWEKAGRPPFTKATVQAFRSSLEGDGLAAATINVRLAAIR